MDAFTRSRAEGNTSFIPAGQHVLPVHSLAPGTFMDGTTIPIASRRVNGSVSIACQWDGCTQDIIGARSHMRDRLRAHVQDCHPSLLDYPDTLQFCLWEGCECRCSRGGRCGFMDYGHAAHVRDILHHIWRSHVKAIVE
jgi:hypothetical protein